MRSTPWHAELLGVGRVPGRIDAVAADGRIVRLTSGSSWQFSSVATVEE